MTRFAELSVFPNFREDAFFLRNDIRAKKIAPKLWGRYFLYAAFSRDSASCM